ncbi:polysaccharide deacetylase family protein [Pedobacter sp. ASV1-7]|uniref:polysaccharide deacetylase family protein n=1 Tax=Pedobacter sp. ASV1-7 TaxID=3145237 RepID=UPI0032E90669
MTLSSLFPSIKKKYGRRGIALMYHRIADLASDPWDLAVSPENFEAHLKVLKDHNVISINELADILTKKKKMPANAITITFDDGYRDNYLVAKPLLEKYNTPACFFMTTDSIGKQKEFWWDALERICLQSPNLPNKLVLEQPINISWDIGSSDNSNVLSPFDLYLKLCGIVRKMPSKKHPAFIKTLEVWANNPHERPENFAMDKKELLDMQSNKLFTIGAHTMTHPFLPYFSLQYQKKEILGSIKYLEELTGNPINFFAYPHGGHNQNTLEILPDLGITLGFTTHADHFIADVDKHAIPRFQVNNWDGETFAFHLNSWIKN